MTTEIEQKREIVLIRKSGDRGQFAAACGFALGFAVAVSAITLWLLSMVGHDDGKDVAALFLLALAFFGCGAHIMDRFEDNCRDRGGRLLGRRHRPKINDPARKSKN
jgi:hypothetical protein